jgi:hypothetical protein
VDILAGIAISVVIFLGCGWLATGVPPKPWMYGERRTALLVRLERACETGELEYLEATKIYAREVGCLYLFGRHSFTGRDSYINRLGNASWKADCRRNGWSYKPLFATRK